MRVLNEETKNVILEYNIQYQKKHGISPSFRNIMNTLKLGSLATVQRYVKQLEADGRLSRTAIGNIAPMRQLQNGEAVIVPLIGQIACGEPCFEVENIEESFALPRSVFGNGELFMLRAFGDSMIDAGINKDDLLVIRKQESADDGDIVVALVNGNNTLKRLYRRNGKIVLHPENKTMEDIIVADCEIQGVLVSCIKLF
jgi:repressor LexA